MRTRMNPHEPRGRGLALALGGLIPTLILVGWLLLPAAAPGYRYWQCNDIPSWWLSPPTFEIMRCSIPPMSAEERDVLYGFNQWNDVGGMWDLFKWQFGTRDCVSIPLGDGKNQIYYGLDSQMDGQWGVTAVRLASSCDWWNSEQNIIEADIAINGQTTFQWGSPWCNSLFFPGSRTTIIHEMGHALGLEHEDNAMNLMMTSSGEGKYCGNFVVEPHPDDADGGRFLYSSGNSSVDLGASDFRFTGPDAIAQNNSPGTQELCPGNSYTFRWSVGNLGTVDQRYNVAWYLSTDVFISTSDIRVGSNSNAFENAGGFDTWSRTIRIPNSVSFGTEYFLGTFIDYDERIAERYETNNRTYMSRKIRIKARGQCP